MSTNVTAFPAGAGCAFSTGGPDVCPITNDMVSYLNLTNGFHEYFQAYCLLPPLDDGCPYGFCPNSDIAGPLVRISSYLTNLFVALLIFYNPEGLRESFWSQILAVYSLLITCGISIVARQLTRIHAIMATATAGSPLSIYIAVYAIRSMWSDANRLAPALGPGHIIPRIIVLTALLIWIGLVVYITLPPHLSDFTQVSCEHRSGQLLVTYFFFLPLVLVQMLPSLYQWVVAVPILLAMIAWCIAICRRRREIWPPGESYSPRIWRVWRVVCDNYPFLQFTTVVFIPFGYWVSIIEVGAQASNDGTFVVTFGQVLAMFVTLPPMIQVAALTPRFCRWFVDLTWVRFLTCRPRGQRSNSTATRPLVLGAAPHGKYDDDNKKDSRYNDYKRLMSDDI